jgi:hypothetical protein
MSVENGIAGAPVHRLGKPFHRFHCAESAQHNRAFDCWPWCNQFLARLIQIKAPPRRRTLGFLFASAEMRKKAL